MDSGKTIEAALTTVARLTRDVRDQATARRAVDAIGEPVDTSRIVTVTSPRDIRGVEPKR